jgi:broad specificity phosphatase PhoE
LEINLIRHGKSLHIDDNWLTCTEFKGWIEKYDRSGVSKEKAYPHPTKEKMQEANIIITSDLTRSIESARYLNPSAELTSSSLFRETELPTFNHSTLKLNPNAWAVILRLLWFSGFSLNCESLTLAKKRAEKAASQLDAFAQVDKKVVLVGHGFFNLLIAKELQKIGWKGPKRTNSKHWSCTTYIK